MSRYTIMLRHHSISRARTVTIDGTLGEAKQRAEKEFGDEFDDLQIAIYHHPPDGDDPWMVCTRRVGGKIWRGAR
jgi:hypothetical protein